LVSEFVLVQRRNRIAEHQRVNDPDCRLHCQTPHPMHHPKKGARTTRANYYRCGGPKQTAPIGKTTRGFVQLAVTFALGGTKTAYQSLGSFNYQVRNPIRIPPKTVAVRAGVPIRTQKSASNRSSC
jgi:hypothetical protein